MQHIPSTTPLPGSTGWSDIAWLVRREIRRSWKSYIASAIYVGLMAMFFAVAFNSDSSAFMLDFVFLATVFVLATNFMRADYFRYSDDPFGPNVAFLRSLPISTSTIVRSRILLMLAAWVLNIPAFFLPWWFVADLDLEPGEFIAFALFWIGISAIGACIASYFEFASTVKRYTVIMSVFALAAAIILGAVEYWTSFRFVLWAIDRARDAGLLLALSGLVIGGAALLVADRSLRGVVLSRDPSA